ncbi:MAG: pilin [Candidatus Paceibacterota bacterium]|jgi:hypothetical protein
MKRLFLATAGLWMAMALATPFAVSAQASTDGGVGSNDPKSDEFQFVPCDGAQKYLRGADGNIITQNGEPVPDPASVPCDFKAFVALFNRILGFLLYLSIPLIIGIVLWTGFKYLSSGGDVSKLQDAKKMLIPVAKGIFFVLAAWLLVQTLLNTLLRDTIGGAAKEDVIFLNIDK